MRRSISLVIALIVFCSIFASCKGAGDKKEASSVSIIETQTSSIIASSKKGTVDRDGENSKTHSEGIKELKNPDTVMLGCFHFNPKWCTYYGADFESRMKEFEDVVSQQYFNTYMLGADEYFLEAVKIIAKYGGTVWVGAGNYNSQNNSSLDASLENYDFYFEQLKKMGLYELVNGFFWEEPFLAGTTNADFQYQTKTFYQKYGLRNFPVLATSSFSDVEGNIGVDTSSSKRVTSEGLKYVTDIAYDVYSIDIREPAGEGQKIRYEQWSRSLNYDVKSGKDYYIGAKKALKGIVGHEVNFWYYPTAYTTWLLGGANHETRATENFCIKMLEFMADDVLKEEHSGGLIIYNYHNFLDDGSKSFEELCDVKNEAGHYKMYPDTTDKWDDYCNALRNTTKKFNSVKGNLAKLDV